MHRERVLGACVILLTIFFVFPAHAQQRIQQIDPLSSKMHFELSGSLFALSGKFSRYNGSISLSERTFAPQKVILKIDTSEVNLAPVENLPYLSPEAIFRALPNPVVTFTSSTIAEISPNKFRIDGVTRRGSKEWKTTFQAVRRKGTAAESEFVLNMRGPVASFISELPPAFQTLQQEGVLECTLNFKEAVK